MSIQFKRLWFWGALLGLLIVALALAFRTRPVPVDLATVQQGSLSVTVDEEGEARVHDVYTLSAPVSGFMRRIDLHPGDPVTAMATVVAEIEPVDPAFLDVRGEAQARAELKAAEAAEALARAAVDRAQAELEFADREHERANELIGEGTISRRELDTAERNYRTARAALATAMAALDVRVFELERARAALVSPAESQATRGQCACVTVRSPVDGRVLQVLQQSEGVVTVGTPLVEVGDPNELEIVVELLSPDAVQVEPGQRVLIERWGGEQTLEGRVRVVEPFAYTKVSALGIEEQRVNVIVDLVSPPAERPGLAHGYQVDARIVLWSEDEVLTVPLLALFRDGDQWSVFIEENGRAALRHVDLGRRNQLEAQVLDGLIAGDRVVMYPSDQVEDGVAIEER